MTKHLVIPDSHAEPSVSNERYDWLGKLILQEKPDVIIDIGDHADMESLSSYDVGKKEYEGRRYVKDVECTRDSLDRMLAPMRKYNKQRARNKKSQYTPRMVLTLGNHEHRINRAISYDPKLEGLISTEDLGYEENGFEVHPYMSPVEIDGVTYAHCLPSGVMGRPIGGEHAAASLLRKNFTSCTVGHSHLRDFSERTLPNGRRIMGLVSGCYFEQYMAYAGQTNKMYWRGVVIKENVRDGMYEHRWVSIDTVKEAV